MKKKIDESKNRDVIVSFLQSRGIDPSHPLPYTTNVSINNVLYENLTVIFCDNIGYGSWNVTISLDKTLLSKYYKQYSSNYQQFRYADGVLAIEALDKNNIGCTISIF